MPCYAMIALLIAITKGIAIENCLSTEVHAIAEILRYGIRKAFAPSIQKTITKP